MTDQITVPTFEQIETILSKLATNYSNIALTFYDVFYNTEAMDVTFQMYNEEGVLETYTIPNRAKDKGNILSDSGSPEGKVEASTGAIYQDLLNGNLYIKKSATGNEGWVVFATKEELDNIIVTGIGNPEAVIEGTKGKLYVDTANSGLYIKTTETGRIGWELISADTSNLVTDEELAEVVAVVNTKEDKANKVTVVNAQSSDANYPSAKAVYTAIEDGISDLANKDLSNLSAEGEDKFLQKDLSNIDGSVKAEFLNIDQIRDCVLAAPEGVIAQTGVGNVFRIPYGTVFLCANGKVENNTKLNNKVVTVTVAVDDAVIPDVPNKKGIILFDGDSLKERCVSEDMYFETDETPTPHVGAIWFSPTSYTYHYEKDGTWKISPMVEIGRYETDSLGYIAAFEPYYPVTLVATEEYEQRTEHVVIEVGGTDDNWYRLYKDGWVEMGGCGMGDTVVDFHKEFKTVTYTFVASGVTSYTKAIDSVTIVAAGDFDWIAKGKVV